jgi:hypothetical protein
VSFADALAVIQRLRGLDAAVDIARPLGFIDQCEDLFANLVGFAMRSAEIEGCLCSAFGQRPYEHGRGRRHNHAMRDSLRRVGAALDEHLVLLPPRYRLSAAISLLKGSGDELPVRRRTMAACDECDDWLLVDRARLLADLEAGFAVAVELVGGGS